MRPRQQLTGAIFLLLLMVLGLGQWSLERTVDAQSRGSAQAPRFEVDPMWPRPMPNHWVLGNAIGVWVDDQDHVRSEERRVGKGVDLGGRRSIKKKKK